MKKAYMVTFLICTDKKISNNNTLGELLDIIPGNLITMDFEKVELKEKYKKHLK